MMSDNLKVFITLILAVVLCGCSDLYKRQEKICLDTKAYDFTEIEITACGTTFVLEELSDKIWSTDGLITIGNCEAIKILGINYAGENVEISELYHASEFGKGVVTARYDIVDLNAEKPWDRVKITGYVDGENLQCNAEMPLPESLK